MNEVEDRDAAAPTSYSSEVADLYRQFVDKTLPMFVQHGWDERLGGLAERLTPDFQPDETPFRRSMVYGRQLYVYSLWGERNNQTSFKENADRVFDGLTSLFFDPTHGGWLETTTLEGAPLSTNRVLYTHAFVLFGLTAYRYCLDRESAGEYLDHTLDYVDQKFKRGARGYFDLLDNTGSDISEGIDQNPIMHLLEGLLFLYEKSQSARALEMAHEIVECVEQSFLKDGMIVEHLTHKFEPDPATGHIVEPGHQFEWAWLFNWYSSLSGVTTFDYVCRTLIDNAMAVGWDSKYGGVYDQVDRHTGAVILPTKRIWPIEELIKSASVFPEHFDALDMPVARLSEFLCTNYLNADGSWYERLNEDLSVADDSLRASTCYHTSLALTEVLKAG